MFRKIFSQSKKEKAVIEKIDAHLRLLIAACEGFQEGLENGNKKQVRQVFHLEREADVVRQEIIRAVYEGAFLPYLRPNLCRFVEIVDREDDLEVPPPHEVDGFFAPPCNGNLEPLCGEEGGAALPEGVFIIHDEDGNGLSDFPGYHRRHGGC